MKNIISYIIIILSLITIGVVGFLFYQKLKPYPIYDTSKLSTITVNGKQYKTTGAIPTVDSATLLSFNQVITLASVGEISTPQFKISTISQYGQVLIEIYQPYDQSKQNALDWLKSNGYDKIKEDEIIFTEK